MFIQINDPVSMSYTDILTWLEEFEPIASDYSPEIQMSFKRQWCWYRYVEDLDEYITYASDVLEEALELNDYAARADLLNCRGFYHYYVDDYDFAFEDLNAALGIAQRLNNSLLIAEIQSTMGDVYSYQGFIAQALASYKTSAQFYQIAGNEFYGNAINTSIAITLKRIVFMFISKLAEKCSLSR